MGKETFRRVKANPRLRRKRVCKHKNMSIRGNPNPNAVSVLQFWCPTCKKVLDPWGTR